MSSPDSNNGARIPRIFTSRSRVRIKYRPCANCWLLLLTITVCHHGISSNASFVVDIMSFVDSVFGTTTSGSSISLATAPTIPAVIPPAKSRQPARFSTSANITLPLTGDKASANDVGTSQGGPGGVLVSVTKVNLSRNRSPVSPSSPHSPRHTNQRRKTTPPSSRREPPGRRPQNETITQPKKRQSPSSNPTPTTKDLNNGRESPPTSTKRTARSPAAVTPVRRRGPGSSPGHESTTLMPEREDRSRTQPPPSITATTTPSGIAPGMPRGNGSSIESVPHVFNPYFGVGPQHNIVTESTSTTSTTTPSPTAQKMKPMINFMNVVAGKPMGLVDVFGMVGSPEPAPPAAAAMPGSSVATPIAATGGEVAVGGVAPVEPVASDGASSNPVVIPTDVTGPPGLEMPAFDIPVTDPKITVNEQNQTGYQQNTWREFLEEIADECPNNDALRAEEIGPERFAHKTNPPKGVTIPASQTTRSPEFFVESVDAGKGGHICLWAKQMLTKMGHVDQPPAGAPGVAGVLQPTAQVPPAMPLV